MKEKEEMDMWLAFSVTLLPVYSSDVTKIFESLFVGFHLKKDAIKSRTRSVKWHL